MSTPSAPTLPSLLKIMDLAWRLRPNPTGRIGPLSRHPASSQNDRDRCGKGGGFALSGLYEDRVAGLLGEGEQSPREKDRFLA